MCGLFDILRTECGEATGCLFSMLCIGATEQFLCITLISHIRPPSLRHDLVITKLVQYIVVPNLGSSEGIMMMFGVLITHQMPS